VCNTDFPVWINFNGVYFWTCYIFHFFLFMYRFFSTILNSSVVLFCSNVSYSARCSVNLTVVVYSRSWFLLLICIEYISYLLWSATADVPLWSRRPASVLIFSPEASKFLSLHSAECIAYLVWHTFNRTKTL
jgi:hypothetical protein